MHEPNSASEAHEEPDSEVNSEAIGRSKGGLSTKIHALVDALGNPIGFYLTPGQACDLDGSDVLLADLVAPILLADKGYDADARVIDVLAAQGKTAVIPPSRTAPPPGSTTETYTKRGTRSRTSLPS